MKPKPKSKTKSIKNQIRSLNRLISRPNTPEDVRKGLEEQLAALQEKSEVKATQLREKKYAVRYHKVKFFERRKVMRWLEQARKKLKHLQSGAQAQSKEDGEIEQIKKRIESLEADIRYIKFYPKAYKYVSLLKTENDDEKTGRKRSRMRELAEKNYQDSLRIKATGGAAAALSDEEEDGDGGDDDFFEDDDVENRDSLSSAEKSIKSGTESSDDDGEGEKSNVAIPSNKKKIRKSPEMSVGFRAVSPNKKPKKQNKKRKREKI